MRKLGLILIFTASAVCAADLKCGACHIKEARDHTGSLMAHALVLPGNNPVFAKHRLLSCQKGNFAYTIATRESQTIYSVSDGISTISVPLHWIFGAENQTFVFDYDGHWYEGLVSYFSEIDGLDTTIGDASIRPRTLLEALGRPIDEAERSACFACHSSGSEANGTVNLAGLTPGLTCDHCHTGALQHQAAALKGSRQFLPANLNSQSTDQLSTFCGQCHRTWETVMRMPPIGSADVRFQPYRLANSKCYKGSDSRISCVACHNPHSASRPSAEVVTSKCLACHTGTATVSYPARVCPVSTTNCASCHMPKVKLSDGHKLFTDHQIRIVRPDDPYPD